MAVVGVWVGHLGPRLGGFWVEFRRCLGWHLDQSLGGVWDFVWIGTLVAIGLTFGSVGVSMVVMGCFGAC